MEHLSEVCPPYPLFLSSDSFCLSASEVLRRDCFLFFFCFFFEKKKKRASHALAVLRTFPPFFACASVERDDAHHR